MGTDKARVAWGTVPLAVAAVRVLRSRCARVALVRRRIDDLPWIDEQDRPIEVLFEAARGTRDFDESALYGLWLARSLVLSESARNVLLLAGDTFSKYCHPQDLAVASLFGDGATASLITADSQNAWAEIGPSALGTDGRGAKNLIVKAGGSRLPASETKSDNYLYMNGAEIASFAVSTVKMVVTQLLDKVQLPWADVDAFVFHQANPAFVQKLMQAYRLPPEKVPVGLANVGNTCSATIPMVLEQCVREGRFRPGQKIVLAGFGVGYSWAATLLEWKQGG